MSDEDPGALIAATARRLSDHWGDRQAIMNALPDAFCEVVGRPIDRCAPRDFALAQSILLRVDSQAAPPLNAEERTALERVLLVLEELRKVYPEMPIRVGITLLHAALNPDISIGKLGGKGRMRRASGSRHTRVLSETRPSKESKLLVVNRDSTDKRRKVVRLTPHGYRVIRTVIGMFQQI